MISTVIEFFNASCSVGDEKFFEIISSLSSNFLEARKRKMVIQFLVVAFLYSSGLHHIF